MNLNEISSILAKRNELDYNYDKAIEELLELSEALMKKKLKRGSTKEIPDSSVIEEIGDVKIRIAILSKLFGEEAVESRVNSKIKAYEGYMQKGKFKNI